MSSSEGTSDLNDGMGGSPVMGLKEETFKGDGSCGWTGRDLRTIGLRLPISNGLLELEMGVSLSEDVGG